MISQTRGFYNMSLNVIKILENVEASYGRMPLTLEINVALRKQICKKIGYEIVNQESNDIEKNCIRL